MSQYIDTDRAYLFGLIIAGGSFSSDLKSLTISLPLRGWGDVRKDPNRASEITQDIVKRVGPILNGMYGLTQSFSMGSVWTIECTGDASKLSQELQTFGISPSAEMRTTSDISSLVLALVDVNLKRRFIAGIADVIGSMAPSHRRFSDDVQIISFEINGFPYKFVQQLCALLHSIDCYPDQVLWNHPNMHSGRDAYYQGWKKGNKIRVALDQFAKFGALTFKSKSLAANENRLKQHKVNVAETCCNKAVVASGIIAKHCEEDFPSLPNVTRGAHFIHHKQICAALGCPYAPYAKVDEILKSAKYHISPFTTLSKGEQVEIMNLVKMDPLMANRIYKPVTVPIKEVFDAAHDGYTMLCFKDQTDFFFTDKDVGYPLNYVLDAIGFICAVRRGLVRGKRISGSRDDLIEKTIKRDPVAGITFQIPDLLTPIIAYQHGYAALIGPSNPDGYEKLISFDPNNKYRMLVRDITEADLKGE